MQKTVLLVEDHEDSREVMKYLIESLGYCVFTAENGLEALKIIARETVDLILMDISMPVMDGLVAIKVIKQHKPAAKVPVIAVTAHSGKFKDDVIALGAVDLISKPIDTDVLKSVLSRYL